MVRNINGVYHVEVELAESGKFRIKLWHDKGQTQFLVGDYYLGVLAKGLWKVIRDRKSRVDGMTASMLDGSPLEWDGI